MAPTVIAPVSRTRTAWIYLTSRTSSTALTSVLRIDAGDVERPLLGIPPKPRAYSDAGLCFLPSAKEPAGRHVDLPVRVPRHTRPRRVEQPFRGRPQVSVLHTSVDASVHRGGICNSACRPVQEG